MNSKKNRGFLIQNHLVHLGMETIKVDIINPKARKLLKDLADLNLIAIRKANESRFQDVLRTLRSDSDLVPDPEEIAREVEVVRTIRSRK